MYFYPVNNIHSPHGQPKAIVRRSVKHLPGYLVLGEFSQCASLPTDLQLLQTHMEKAAEMMGAHIIKSIFHEFSPQGLSGVVVIKESHFAIHTWPEYNYAAVDLFSCGKMDYKKGFGYLREVFGAREIRIAEILRGK